MNGDPEMPGRDPSPRVIAGFLAAPPVVGIVTALTLSAPGKVNEFRFVGIVATIVAALATMMLGVPTFHRLEENRRTAWPTYLGKGALLGVIVSALFNVPLLFMLLLPHILEGLVSEVLNDLAAISSFGGYCAFLGTVGAAAFWLIVRPDRRSAP